MNLKQKAGAVLAGGLAICAALAAPMNPDPAEAFGNPRIIVHVAGTQAGTIEFQNVDSYLPDLLIDNDSGEIHMPTNYCGLRVTNVGGIWWHDANGNVVLAENHGEINYVSGQGYMFMGEEVSQYYFGGVVFTGALETCADNAPWYFPTPLSYGGNGPQFGAQRLILELDHPGGYQSTIEFLDHAAEPVELPDLYKDWEPPGGLEEFCEQVPEFCEPKTVPWNASDELFWVCLIAGSCPVDPGFDPGFTLGCMAYATGCNPDPRPVESMATPSVDPKGESRPIGTPAQKLAPATR